MANGKVLRQLIKAGADGDANAFRRVSESIIKDERQKQHHLLANDLESILYGDRASSTNKEYRRSLPPPPEDKERGFPLLDVKQTHRGIDEIILNSDNLEPLSELLEEHRREDVLRSYGMRPSNKVIFFGPPGCGKTLAAEIIAFELDRPFALVRLDAVVSSFLGQTAANLRNIFEYISENKFVVLFDEFDAIGKERDDSGEHGELRRVVNAVLQMMDSYSGKSLILAATNHEHILDAAIWRRFDEAIEFELPDESQIAALLKLKLRGVRRHFEVDDPEVLEIWKSKSGAEIERVCRRAVKRMILRGREFLTKDDLFNAIRRESKK